tara:strand:+ start:1501 stop:1656 length:156 start_codon:yes stop_codon:yes gene_type:complete
MLEQSYTGVNFKATRARIYIDRAMSIRQKNVRIISELVYLFYGLMGYAEHI